MFVKDLDVRFGVVFLSTDLKFPQFYVCPKPGYRLEAISVVVLS
jgi:hypothetical protein